MNQRREELYVSTGIKNLDEILGGGFVRGMTYLVSGQAGTGKSIFGLQYLSKGSELGEKGLYVTFDETQSDPIRQLATRFNFDLSNVALIPYWEEGIDRLYDDLTEKLKKRDYDELRQNAEVCVQSLREFSLPDDESPIDLSRKLPRELFQIIEAETERSLREVPLESELGESESIIRYPIQIAAINSLKEKLEGVGDEQFKEGLIGELARYRAVQMLEQEPMADAVDINLILGAYSSVEKYERIVVDPVIGILTGLNQNLIRDYLRDVVHTVRNLGVTAVITSEIPTGQNELLSRYGLEEYIADGIIVLGLERKRSIRGRIKWERTFTVRKNRYGPPSKPETYKFEITPGKGIVIK